MRVFSLCLHPHAEPAQMPPRLTTPGRSLSLLLSLHGGSKVNMLTMPDQQMRSSSSNQASSRMSCSALASRSKASKRARPCLSAAAEIGAWRAFLRRHLRGNLLLGWNASLVIRAARWECGIGCSLHCLARECLCVQA